MIEGVAKYIHFSSANPPHQQCQRNQHKMLGEKTLLLTLGRERWVGKGCLITAERDESAKTTPNQLLLSGSYQAYEHFNQLQRFHHHFTLPGAVEMEQLNL